MHYPKLPQVAAALFAITLFAAGMAGCDLDRPQEESPDSAPTDSGTQRNPAPESLDRLSEPFGHDPRSFQSDQPQRRPTFHSC